MSIKEEYRARKAAQETKYKHPILERFFWWWRNPPDRFAFLVALFTAGLFFATLKLWQATISLVEDAERASEANTRAYVVITGIKWDGPPEIAKNQRIKILFRNVGKEAASDFNLSVLVSPPFFFEPDGKGMPYIPPDKVQWPYIECHGDLPGQRVIGHRPVYPDVPNEAIWYAFNPGGNTLGDVYVPQELLDGKATIWVAGCAVYRSLNKTRHSPFCFYYQPARGQDVIHGTFEWCPTGAGNAD